MSKPTDKELIKMHERFHGNSLFLVDGKTSLEVLGMVTDRLELRNQKIEKLREGLEVMSVLNPESDLERALIEAIQYLIKADNELAK